MNIHKNARLTPRGRELIVARWQAGESPGAIASATGVSPATVYKWLRRFRSEGLAGLADHSSRPHRLQSRITPDQLEQVRALRGERLPYWRIARLTGIPRSPVARAARRLGCHKLPSLQPPVPIIRYEREAPGDMIHIDTKKLGRIDGIGHRITGNRTGQSNKRGTGWEVLHLAVDDHSRLAYSEVLPDEKRPSCIRFLLNALRFFKSHGIKVHRVMTDNGSSFRSYRYAKALRLLHIKHVRTRPFTPRTNGKAERFVQTSLREWAYAKAYAFSAERTAALKPWLDSYNTSRPHFGLNGQTPAQRLAASLNNLAGHDN